MMNHYNQVKDTYGTYNVENGRAINLDAPADDFMLFDSNDNKNDKFKFTAIKGIQSVSPLSLSFFSNYNIERVQDLIRYNVYIKSDKKHIISKQSVIELQILMRSMYLQHAKNTIGELKQQVDELNEIVVGWAVPKILEEISQYNGYIHEQSNLPIPLEHPKQLTSKGTKSLRSVTTTF